MPRKIVIGKRQFVRGKAECMCCDHKFKYLLPLEFLPFWEQACAECSLAFPDTLPEGNEIILTWGEGSHEFGR